jgi:predicted nucleic acid-binding protein
MTTAVDSSVLWAILKNEPGAADWAEVLQTAASDGPLVLCPVVFSELAPSTTDAASLLSLLSRLGLSYDPLSPEAAHLAGVTFQRYRHAGGPRQHLVPDFLIAAHASVQADRLAAIDRGYLRRWFPALALLQPRGAAS